MADNLRNLFRLDPDVTYLTHGTYGACPEPVFRTYQEWQARLERQPVAFLNPSHLFKRYAEARAVLGGYLGAAPDDLVPMINATEALNVVARSLPLRPGDEILTTDHEYGALEKTWAFVVGQTGAVIRRVTVPLPLTSEADFTRAVLSGFTNRTRVLFLSHITSPTALLFPIELAIAHARARGVWSVIDGAHAPGQVRLDLNALGADFYAGNCHKWMMAPKGAAFLHARAEVQGLLDPAVISHGWTPEGTSPGPFGGTAFIDRFQMQGTLDPSAFFAVPAAIGFGREYDWDRVTARCRVLAQETAGRVAAIAGLSPIAAPGLCAPQMVSMPVPDCDTQAAHGRLLSEFGIEIPVLRWNGRCFIRLSVQGYNSRADMDRLVTAIGALFAPSDQRVF